MSLISVARRTILRRRFLGIFGGSFIALLLLWAIDPTNPYSAEFIQAGGGFIITAAILLKTCIYLAMLHFSRKILFDYIDLGDIYEKSIKDTSSIGSSLFAVGVGLWAIAVSVVIAVAAFA